MTYCSQCGGQNQDGARFVDIFQTNRELLRVPDPLTPGTVLVIPGVEDQ